MRRAEIPEKCGSSGDLQKGEAHGISYPGSSLEPLNTRMSELRPAPREQILLIEEDGPLRKVLRRLLSLEGV
jgi:hypothetical protein